MKNKQDIERIHRVLRDNEIHVSKARAEKVWIQYSNIMESDWYPLPSDKKILKHINHYLV